MRPVSDLGKLKSAIDFRLIRIRRLFRNALAYSSNGNGPLFAVAAIELDNLVLSSIRVFTISSLRNARTVSGKRIATSAIFWSEGEIAAYIMSVIRPLTFERKGCPPTIRRMDEITVRDPRDVEKVLIACASSNTVSWQTALSLNSTLFSDLCTIRNFYAHRNEDTWLKVKIKSQQMGVVGVRHPDEFMARHVPGRSVTFFEDWLDDTALFFDVCTI